MKTTSYLLPEHWACALINGDESGLDDCEQEALDSFVAYMVEKHGACHCVDVGEHCGFVKYHDAQEYGVLACDVANFIFDVKR